MDFMEIALKEAKKAFEEGEVPVGCVIVKNGKIIVAEHNRVLQLKDPFAHAEMLSLNKVMKENIELDDAEIYITVEPCMMCTGAILRAGIKKMIFGTVEPKTGFVITNFNLRSYVDIEVIDGIREKESKKLMEEFFKLRRDGRADEGARLEIAFSGNRNGGSNPSPSAGRLKFYKKEDE